MSTSLISRITWLLVLLTLALPGCKPKVTAELSVLNLARPQSHRSLDPPGQFDSASGDIISNVYDTLLEYHYLERPVKLQPNLLAEMPSLAEDGVTYTMKVRKGVYFIDNPCFPGGKGRELTADDVIYSLKRYADANVNRVSYPVLMKGMVEGMDDFRDRTRKLGKDKVDYDKLKISGLKKIDSHTLIYKLARPNPLAMFPLASFAVAIYPREAVEHYGDRFARNPVGTGPFYMHRYSHRGVMVLRKNPRYHQRYPGEGEAGDREKGLLADAGKQLPLVEEVRLLLVEESQPRMLKFKRGRLDNIGLDKDNFVKMAYRDEEGEFHLRKEFQKQFNMSSAETLITSYMMFNMRDSLLGGGGDKARALRQALAHALDMEGFIEAMRNGRGKPMSTLVPLPIAGSERYLKKEGYAVPGYETNLALARKKLAEAGYPGGKGLPPILVEYRSTSNDVMQEYEYHRAQLAKVGITLKGNFQTFSTFLKRVEEGNFQVASAGWMADYPDAENFHQLLYGPNKAPGPNEGNYANAEYDQLYEQIKYMKSGAERSVKLARMASIAHGDTPVMAIWSPIGFGLAQKWVRNRKPHTMVDAPYKYLGIDGPTKKKVVAEVY